MIFRPINRLETINGTPQDEATISFIPQSKGNKGFAESLDREKGKVYEVRNTRNGKYFYGTYTGHHETTNGNIVLWFKEGFCVEISNNRFDLAPIEEGRGKIYSPSRRSGGRRHQREERVDSFIDVARGLNTLFSLANRASPPNTSSNEIVSYPEQQKQDEIKVGEIIPLNMWCGVDRLKQLAEGTQFRFKGLNLFEQEGNCTFKKLEVNRELLRYKKGDGELSFLCVPRNDETSIEIISLPEPPTQNQTYKKVTLKPGQNPQGHLEKGRFYKCNDDLCTVDGNKLVDWHKDDSGLSLIYCLEFKSSQSKAEFWIHVQKELTFEEIG